MADFYIREEHFDEVLKECTGKVRKALEEVGVQAVNHAVTNITEQGAIDTGLLRNSLTYCMDGEAPKKANYKASYGSNRKANGSRYSARSKKAGTVGEGSYNGTAPSEGNNKNAVYIGTNVYYAPYVEFGSRANHTPPRPYLAPAISQNLEEFKMIIDKVLHDK